MGSDLPPKSIVPFITRLRDFVDRRGTARRLHILIEQLLGRWPGAFLRVRRLRLSDQVLWADCTFASSAITAGIACGFALPRWHE